MKATTSQLFKASVVGGLGLLACLFFVTAAQAEAPHCREACQKNYQHCLVGCRTGYARCQAKATKKLSRKNYTSKNFYKAHDLLKACTTTTARCQAACKASIRKEFLMCQQKCEASCPEQVKKGLFATLAECSHKLCSSHSGVITAPAQHQLTPLQEARQRMQNRRKVPSAAEVKKEVKETQKGNQRRRRCFFRKCKKSPTKTSP